MEPDMENRTWEEQLAAVESSNLPPEERELGKAAILRQVLKEEWLHIWELRSKSRGARHEGQKSRANLKSRGENVKTVKALAAQLQIVARSDIKAVETLPFPYFDLPPGVRVEVLNRLATPLDKLNMAEAFPNEAALARWDSHALRFEAIIFPNLMKQGDLHWRHWKSFETLRKSGPNVRKAINEEFALYLKESDRDNNNYNQSLSDLLAIDPADQWSSEDPITGLLTLELSNDNQEENDAAHLDRLKNWAGPRLWYCHFDYYNSFSPEVYFHSLCRSLGLMPNLRKIELQSEEHEEEDDPGWNVTWEQLENVVMPELPFLKTLHFCGESTREVAILRKKLLQSYAATITNLAIDYRFESVPLDDFQLPRLEFWTCGCRHNNDNWKFQTDMLQRLIGAPLKKVTCKIYGNVQGFPEFLAVLGTNFGQTLEALEIDTGYHSTLGSISPDDWKSNMANLSFPKLTQFTINATHFPGGWDFLLFFPNLEKFTFSPILRLDAGNDLGQTDDEDAILQMSFNVPALRGSNVWKLFPNLQEISRGASRGWLAHRQTPAAKITREECIKALAK